MAKFRELVLDAWSSLSHKAPFRDDARARVDGWTPATWMGDEHRRRLTAYVVLAAYYSNVAREFLTIDDVDKDERREYGDAALVVDQTLAHLLGESQEVVVPGAEAFDPDMEEPQPPAAGGTPEENVAAQADYAAAVEAWNANREAADLAERQDFLQAWADSEHLPLRLVESEGNAVKLGDGVYLLGWSEAKQRPTARVIEPDAYFPVLSEDDEDYPDVVHLAWEIPPDEDEKKVRVRRQTWRLGYLTDLLDVDQRALSRAETPEEIAAAVGTLPDGASWVDDPDSEDVAALVRDYPWNEEPSDRVCLFTDATWYLEDLNDAHNVDAFQLDSATVAVAADGTELRDTDLGIDFVPIVHEPNTPAGADHFGQSSLAKVLQILDDLQGTDSDVQKASATTGSPIIGVSGDSVTPDSALTGQRGKEIRVEPGIVLKLGMNGRMDVLNTAPQLKELREESDGLLDRLSVNSRLPAALLGRVSPSEVPSGFAMVVSFGPLSAMIRQMRLVRAVKHPLIMKFVQRLYQANGVLDPGPTPRAEIALGSYLPSDVDAVIERVSTLFSAKLISLETALTMLIEGGVPIEDVQEEVARIQQRDFEGGNALADATGDTAATRDYLGLEPADVEAPAGLPPLVQ